VTKRINGEGTFTQRPNGTWQARLAYVDDDGVTKRPSFYGKTRAEAKAKLDEARRRLDAGAPAKDAVVTVADWCETYRTTSLAASSRATSTKEGKEITFRLYVRPTMLGKMPLAKLRPTSVEAWLVELRSWVKPVKGEDGKPAVDEDGKPVTRRRLSEATLHKAFYHLSVALDGAVRDKLLAKNPCTQVDPPKPEDTEARFFTEAETLAILDAARAIDNRVGGIRTTNYPILAFIAATGIRKGEAIGLKWEDVNFEAGTVQVNGTKSKKSKRPLKLAPGVVKLLRSHRTRQLELRLAAGSQWIDSGRVFTSATGQPKDPSNVLRAVKTAAAKAGVADAKVHSMRHAAATAMLESGIPLHAVSRILGHSKTNVTAEVYAHLTRDMNDQAMDVASKFAGL